MRVALDATPLTLAAGGLRRYAEELSLALAREYPEDDYWLLCDFPFRIRAGAPPNLRPGACPAGPLWRRWWLAGLPREIARRNCELFHGTNFLVPWLPLRPAVVTIHDLSPWICLGSDLTPSRPTPAVPNGPTPSSFVRRRAAAQLRLGLPAMLLTPTEAVRAELVRHFRLPASKVVSVPLAASPKFQPREDGKLPAPYLLYVGDAQPRKNLPMLFDAWRETHARTGVTLVWVGSPDVPVSTTQVPLPAVRFTREMSDEELARWYTGAAAVVYPSLYEGFGLPVLEAMQCGAAVIASRIPAIQEVACDGAILLDPRDGRAWAEAMTAAVLNPEGLAGVRARARRRAAAFSWERTARLTREVYQEALRRWERRNLA